MVSTCFLCQNKDLRKNDSLVAYSHIQPVCLLLLHFISLNWEHKTNNRHENSQYHSIIFHPDNFMFLSNTNEHEIASIINLETDSFENFILCFTESPPEQIDPIYSCSSNQYVPSCSPYPAITCLVFMGYEVIKKVKHNLSFNGLIMIVYMQPNETVHAFLFVRELVPLFRMTVVCF